MEIFTAIAFGLATAFKILVGIFIIVAYIGLAISTANRGVIDTLKFLFKS